MSMFDGHLITKLFIFFERDMPSQRFNRTCVQYGYIGYFDALHAKLVYFRNSKNFNFSEQHANLSVSETQVDISKKFKISRRY